MRMERAAGGGGPVVMGLGPAGFRLGEESYPAVLMTVQAAASWSPPPLAELSVADLRALIDAAPEFIVLGTGATLVRPPMALTRALETAGIGLEPMDSRAAARAWGVLRSEGRQVGAALYPFSSPA